jgi:hypothetical protein
MYEYTIILSGWHWKEENKSIDARGRLEITDNGCLKIIDSEGIVLTINKKKWKNAFRVK